MTTRSLPLAFFAIVCASAFAEEPPANLPPVRLGAPMPASPVVELPPLLSVPTPAPTPKKHCRSCATDYHPSHVYLPEHSPDFATGGCDGDCQPCRRGWVDLAFFAGKAEDLGNAENRKLYGGQGEIGYWFNDERSVGLAVGFLTSHAAYREIQGGPLLIDAPVTVTALDASLRTELFVVDRFRFDGLVGYQYVQLHEKLLTGNTTTLSNQSARNTVNGGRVGLVADYRYGAYFVDLTGAIGLGRNSSDVIHNGVTTDATFCVIPEFGARVGYQLGESLWIHLGYTLLYMSDVQRPATVGSTSFYMHGVALGCEKRF